MSRHLITVDPDKTIFYRCEKCHSFYEKAPIKTCWICGCYSRNVTEYYPRAYDALAERPDFLKNSKPGEEKKE